MDPILIGTAGFMLWLFLNKKKGAVSPLPALSILGYSYDFKKVKYRLQVGGVSVESWILKGDKTQVFEKNGYLFSADYLPDGSGISFFIYKLNPDTLIFSRAFNFQ